MVNEHKNKGTLTSETYDNLHQQLKKEHDVKLAQETIRKYLTPLKLSKKNLGITQEGSKISQKMTPEIKKWLKKTVINHKINKSMTIDIYDNLHNLVMQEFKVKLSQESIKNYLYSINQSKKELGISQKICKKRHWL